ncbi:hypothetical protein ACCO45_006401 [Purpureocillium lilacinum]|uniref:Uncharacterized protein n=1 Tax=Purpureocillium lilacinum TaxID=33203 RepID=A0ACC4DQU8_PURLI
MRLILIVAIWTCSIISIVEGEGREGRCRHRKNECYPLKTTADGMRVTCNWKVSQVCDPRFPCSFDDAPCTYNDHDLVAICT